MYIYNIYISVPYCRVARLWCTHGVNALPHITPAMVNQPSPQTNIKPVEQAGSWYNLEQINGLKSCSAK